MKARILHSMLLMMVVFTAGGCVQYANIDRVRLGMSAEELMRIDTPCYYRGTKGDKVSYNCQFKVPSREYGTGHSVKPYILTFENNKLTEIDLNEHELDRQQMRMRDWYYGPGYYYPYGHPYYRYHYGPYWYP